MSTIQTLNAEKYHLVETEPEMMELTDKHVEINTNYIFMNIARKIWKDHLNANGTSAISEVKIIFDGISGRRKDEWTWRYSSKMYQNEAERKKYFLKNCIHNNLWENIKHYPKSDNRSPWKKVEEKRGKKKDIRTENIVNEISGQIFLHLIKTLTQI